MYTVQCTKATTLYDLSENLKDIYERSNLYNLHYQTRDLIESCQKVVEKAKYNGLNQCHESGLHSEKRLWGLEDISTLNADSALDERIIINYLNWIIGDLLIDLVFSSCMGQFSNQAMEWANIIIDLQRALMNFKEYPITFTSE